MYSYDGKHTEFINSPTAHESFHNWFLDYKDKVLFMVKSVDIYGDNENAKKLAAPCRECIIQATCYELLQCRGCYKATIEKVCMPLFEWVDRYRSCIKLYKINYTKQHIYFGL